jgi:hypothetical protein
VSEGTARNRALRSSNCPARRWWSLSPECDGPEQSTVRQIRQRLADPLWNGAAIGAGRMSRCLRCGGGGQRRAREYEPAGVRRSQRCDAAVWRPMRCSPQVSAPQSVSGSTPSSGVERPSRQHPTANPRHVSSFAHSSGRTQGARAFRLDGEANYYLNLPSFQKWACPISWTTTGCGPSLRRLQQLGHRRHDSMPADFLGAQLLPAGGGQRV